MVDTNRVYNAEIAMTSHELYTGAAEMMETTFLKVGKRCINVSNIGWTETGGDLGNRWIDLIFSNHQKLRLENQDAETLIHFLEGYSTTLL